jgi:hypothetical protein
MTKYECLGRTKRLLSFDTTRTAQKTTPTILGCRENVVSELLPGNDRGIQREREREREEKRKRREVVRDITLKGREETFSQF